MINNTSIETMSELNQSYRINSENFSFRVWEARVKVSQDSREPGTIVSGKKTLDIMTGKDILSITKLQLPGKKMISVKDFLNGYANLIED